MTKPFRLTALKPFIPSEFQEQCVVFEWAKYCRLDGIELLFSTLNGVKLPIGLAVKMKKAGMKAGVPDIILPVPKRWPDGGFKTCGLFIELKRARGAYQRPGQEQRDWHDALTGRGFKVVVAKGANEAIAAIKEYLDA